MEVVFDKEVDNDVDEEVAKFRFAQDLIVQEVSNALCVFFFREVSIGKFAKMSTSPFIFTFTF